MNIQFVSFTDWFFVCVDIFTIAAVDLIIILLDFNSLKCGSQIVHKPQIPKYMLLPIYVITNIIENADSHEAPVS